MKTPYVVKPENLIFALDVGTRTVVGVICHPEGENLKVLDVEIEEHPQRDMLDGQIHQIEGVTRTVKKVKSTLEKRLGCNLEKVSVAAAGRALKTVKVTVGRDISGQTRIGTEEISQLELEGAQKAQNQLFSSEESPGNASSYYCIGYTTVKYLLDGHPISSLVSQKGHHMEAEVLATFLPDTVVDSLLTVIEKAGLTLHSLTLEPIAAIQALIPPEYRHLNLALIDIGAGTSDIAITNRGSIIAYAMVPLAGDEITEMLAHHYLLDFATAEKLKMELSQEHYVYNVTDIIGNTREVSLEELKEVISPAITELTQYISKNIIHYNHNSPSALFCIGGGSRTPGLQKEFAETLGLPLERVAIRESSMLNRIIDENNYISGPEGVTPLGIALSALREKFFGFSYVTVNGKVIRLLETEPTTVGKCLLAAGYHPRDLVGLKGPSLQITINGEEKQFPGKPGENANLLLNQKTASLETTVKPNDEITVEKAQKGKAPEITVEDLQVEKGAYIFLNGTRVYIPSRILVNGEEASYDRILAPGDEVKTKELGTLEDLSQLTEIDFSQTNELTVNGERVALTYRLQPEDQVEWR